MRVMPVGHDFEPQERAASSGNSPLHAERFGCAIFRHRVSSIWSTALEHMNRVKSLSSVAGNPAYQLRLSCISIDAHSLLQVGRKVARKVIEFLG